MTDDILVDLGLSVNEAKIYRKMLSLGLCTITKISQDTKLHRSNVYDSVKRLIDKGLVGYVKQENVTLYEANDPNSLIHILKDKENRLKQEIPQLLLNKQLADSKGQAYVLEGVDSVMKLLYDFLEYEEPILVYGIPKTAPDMMKTKIPHFHKERMKRKIVMKHIYNFAAKDRIDYLNTLPFTEAKYLNEEIKSQVATVVCGDNVLISLWIKPVMVIHIKSKLIAESYKSYFEVLYKSCK